MISRHRFPTALCLAAVALASCISQPNSLGLLSNAIPNASHEAGSPLTKSGHGAIYVTDLFNGQVIIVRNNGTSEIKGKRTHLFAPISLAREPGGDLVVVNARKATPPHTPGSVVTLPAKAGDVPAKHVIRCKQFSPWGVAIDSSSNIWVADSLANSISEYSQTANGCTTPIAVIAGPATQLSAPLGVAINSQGQIVVENFLSNMVEIFAQGASGNVAPIVRIFGSNTQISHSEGIAVDANDNIWVTNYGTAGSGTAAVLEFDKSARGNVAPTRAISGPATMLGATIGVAVDRRTGEIYTCNGGNGYRSQPGGVFVFASDANGNVAPVQRLLQGSFPTGIVLPN